MNSDHRLLKLWNSYWMLFHSEVGEFEFAAEVPVQQAVVAAASDCSIHALSEDVS